MTSARSKSDGDNRPTPNTSVPPLPFLIRKFLFNLRVSLPLEMKLKTWLSIALAVVVVAAISYPFISPQPTSPASTFWQAPDTSLLANDPNAELIRYGRDLIAHTAKYLGPEGSVAHISNGMNCQNCHIDAGTKTFALNYGGVAATYPQVRPRSNRSTSIATRVNECLERSLNGQPLDTTSHEMRAILKYINWLGASVPKGKRPEGAGLNKLAYLNRAADPARGQTVYITQCAKCHGPNGEGITQTDHTYAYPPLWGPHSFNDGAGLYRVSNFAAFVRSNMPFGATFEVPTLTEEEAWDVAAFVNSQPRPHKDQSQDWPQVQSKPVDHPFGPFADPFSESQHKFGPFGPIKHFRDSIQTQSK